MNYFYLAFGIALVSLALIDALWTTLWVDGSGGPVSSRVTTWIWRPILAVNGRKRHHALSFFGPLILFLIVVMWVVLLWAGWVFIFASVEQALMNTRDHTPADWAGRIYFVAYTMFTMGNGDLSPEGDVWQIVTALTNGSGMFLVTLAITYLLSVISAAVRKRAFATQITGLGQTAEDFVIAGWDGNDLRSFDLALNSLSSELAMLSEQYLAYPILQYYHAAKASKSPVLAIAALSDALMILRYGVDENVRPNPVSLRSAHSAVESFIEAMPSSFVHAAPEPPPLPQLDKIRKEGIPAVDDETFRCAIKGMEERRRKLLGLVRNDGWNWGDKARHE